MDKVGENARRAAVRYAGDDDCPAGCGHPEPVVLAPRCWSVGLLNPGSLSGTSGLLYSGCPPVVD
jgi:hypothetical protein